MRKEMGNQNTSGILVEDKNTNEGPERVEEISCSDDLKEENKILIQEDESKDVQKRVEESESQEAEADKVCPVEELSEKEVANGSLNEDCETRTSTSLYDVPSNLKESDLEEEVSKFDDEAHDQPCTLNEEKQICEFNFEAKSMSNATSLSCLHQEAVDIAPESHEDHDNLVKENDEKLGVDDPPQEEQINSFDELNDHQTISLQDLSASENEKRDELLVLNKDKLTMNELVNQDHTSYDLENVFLDDEAKEKDDIDQIESSKSLESNSSEEVKDTNEVTEVLNEVGLVQSISIAHNQEQEKPKVESSESETSVVEECATLSQSLPEIKNANEFHLDESESKGNETTEKLSVESNPSYKSHQVELKKSPSFDFGIPFDPKSQESDQTPLLYQDRPTRRSFSSCSGLRFQNRSVQTEYLGKPLQHETVEVEEKTITMERSHSESSRKVAREKQDDFDEDCDIVSPKGNGKRKPRSSLFSTCICCTAAIS